MSKREDFMTVRELVSRLQTASEDKEVLIAVFDKEGKWMFDANIQNIGLDRFSGKLVVFDVQEED